LCIALLEQFRSFRHESSQLELPRAGGLRGRRALSANVERARTIGDARYVCKRKMSPIEEFLQNYDIARLFSAEIMATLVEKADFGASCSRNLPKIPLQAPRLRG